MPGPRRWRRRGRTTRGGAREIPARSSGSRRGVDGRPQPERARLSEKVIKSCNALRCRVCRCRRLVGVSILLLPLALFRRRNESERGPRADLRRNDWSGSHFAERQRRLGWPPFHRRRAPGHHRPLAVAASTSTSRRCRQQRRCRAFRVVGRDLLQWSHSLSLPLMPCSRSRSNERNRG